MVFDIKNEDFGFDKMVTAFKKNKKDLALDAGIIEGNKNVDKKHKDEEGKPEPYTIAEIAAVHEFGSLDEKIPERSFIVFSADKNEKKNLNKIKHLLRKVSMGEMTTEQALDELGVMRVGQIMSRLNTIKVPVLKPKTIRRKKNQSSKPLIDSGLLKTAIGYSVRRPK